MKLGKFLATDFFGKKSADALPEKLSQGCSGGNVLTIANSLVLKLIGTEWFRNTQYKLVVVDKNNDHILEITQLMKLARKSKTLIEFRNRLAKKFDEASAAALETRGLINENVHKGLQIDNRIVLLNEDLSDPEIVTKIRAEVNQNPFSMLYLSNVEFYVGPDNLFGKSAGGKSDYGNNIRLLIETTTKVYRGTGILMSEHVGAMPDTWCIVPKTN